MAHAVKVFEPSDEEIAAVKAQWARTPTRRQVTKPATKPAAKAKTPDIQGAFWSDDVGAYIPYAWGGYELAAKAGDGKAVMSNPHRQFRGQPGAVADYSGGAFGRKRAIEVRFDGQWVKGFIDIQAGMTMFNPTEVGAPGNAPVMLKPGMTYRIPAGVAE